MKPIILTIAFLVAIMGAKAQDTTKVKKIQKRIVIIHKSNDSLPNEKDTIVINSGEVEEPDCRNCDDRAPAFISSTDFNFGFANVKRSASNGNANNSLPELNNGKSFGIGLGQNWGFNLIKGKLRLWTGIRYDIKNYRFANNKVNLNKEAAKFGYKVDSSGNAEKSKVVVNYLGIPLALGYQTNPRDHEDGFSVRAGVTAGYRVRTHTKVNHSSSNKEKQFDDFNFNDFALSPFFQIGYNSVFLYGRYSMTSLFKTNQGPTANAFEFGILIQ